MISEWTSKQPYEEYKVSFNFATILGTEDINSASITAVDQNSLVDMSSTILDLAKQYIEGKIVYAWVRGGVSGYSYLITCRVIGSSATQYELEAILPVQEVSAGVPQLKTLQQILTASFRKLGLGRAPDNEDLTDFLESLQHMLNHWSAKNIPVYIYVTGTNPVTGRVVYPYGYEAAIIYNLAVWTAPEYGVIPSATIKNIAESTFYTVLSNKEAAQVSTVDLTLFNERVIL